MLKKDVLLADGSSPSMPASSIMSALIAGCGESRALCALAASSIVSDASSTCGSRGAIAAAFEDMDTDAVGDVLRKKC